MDAQNAGRPPQAFIRWVRTLWPVVFLVPLGFWAGRDCALSITDPVYHALLWAHERIWMIWAALALLSVGSAAARVFGAERGVSVLLDFASEPTSDVQSIFNETRSWLNMSAGLVVLDLPARIAFPHWRRNAVVISSGVLRGLTRSEVRLVMLHELEHLRRRDQWRALVWHVFFALLILPGFSAIEQLLNRRRERSVDDMCRLASSTTYARLLERNTIRRDKLYGSICTSKVGVPGLAGLNAAPQYLADRTLPAALSVLVLALVLLSQMLFISALPFLETHHC